MENNFLLEALQARSQLQKRPDKSSYKAILFADVQDIAQKYGKSLREVEETALAAGIVPERYCRNQKTLSNKDQLLLLQSHVAVIGLGGLGGTVVEILARLGVGTLTLVDGDSFDESNLNRQLLSSPAVIGQAKAACAKNRVQEINPAVDVYPIPEFFEIENGQAILNGVDLAIDCLDTIASRLTLEQFCKKCSIPLVSSAIAGSSGQATVVFPEDPGLCDIYGPPEKIPERGIETTLGTLPFGAVYMAAVECAAATNILLNKTDQLRNRLFLAEIGDHTSELFDLPGLQRK